PARPGRPGIAGRLTDANVDEAPFRAFTPHLVAEEFRTRLNANRDIEGERLARARIFRIERMAVFGLEAVQDAGDRRFNLDAKVDRDLVRASHQLGSRDLGQLIGVDHPSAGEALHYGILVLARHREATLGPAELAVERDHIVLGIPGVVNDDR